MTRCHFIPPYVLEKLDDPDQLAVDAALRAERAAAPLLPPVSNLIAVPAWTVHDAHGLPDLPGDVVRTAGEPEVGDVAADEAAAGVEATLAFFSEVYHRDSYDGYGMPVVATVHYLKKYSNAFWNGTQLVIGDGDGVVFDRLSRSVDVLAHELTHAVTEYAAKLVYEDQSGALSESVSDVFASCLKQRLRGEDAAAADWLIGTDIFVPGIAARGLRDLAAPGTAYDDAKLGKDPQVGHMDDYLDTRVDHGGVHTNSGIANRAFHLAAVAIGGTSWDGAGRVWYDALVGLDNPHADFADFAAATIAAAGPHVDAVTAAWASVGVTPADTTPGPAPTAEAAATSGTGTVSVRRSGGFAGLVADGAADLDDDQELRELVDAVDVDALSASTPHPDQYVYDFDFGDHTVTVSEQDLTPELREVADRVLAKGETPPPGDKS